MATGPYAHVCVDGIFASKRGAAVWGTEKEEWKGWAGRRHGGGHWDCRRLSDWELPKPALRAELPKPALRAVVSASSVTTWPACPPARSSALTCTITHPRDRLPASQGREGGQAAFSHHPTQACPPSGALQLVPRSPAPGLRAARCLAPDGADAVGMWHGSLQRAVRILLIIHVVANGTMNEALTQASKIRI